MRKKAHLVWPSDIKFSACANSHGIEAIPWGALFIELVKNGEKIITI